MKRFIAFYISSHGFGHMSRSLAIIKEIIKLTDFNIYIACQECQNDFAKKFLLIHSEIDRVYFRNIQTDIGLINESNSLVVNKAKLQDNLNTFIEGCEDVIKSEYQLLITLNIKFVVSDISILGPLVAERLNVQSIGLSNFTWVEQYKHLNIKDNILQYFESAYSKFDRFIEYAFAVPINHGDYPVEKVGLIAREQNLERIHEIKKEYGQSIYISVGRSASLNPIQINNYNGTIIITKGIEAHYSKTVSLPIEICDTQNYIASSDLVISKAGWGTIAEALIAGKKLVLLERKSAYEDTYLINELKINNLAISISEEELCTLDIENLINKANKSIDTKKLGSFSNDFNLISKLLLL